MEYGIHSFELSAATKVPPALFPRVDLPSTSPCQNSMKTSQHSAPSRQAFSRLELTVVLFTLALLAAEALPVLAGTRPRADRITCVNNLRQIGKAFNS